MGRQPSQKDGCPKPVMLRARAASHLHKLELLWIAVSSLSNVQVKHRPSLHSHYSRWSPLTSEILFWKGWGPSWPLQAHCQLLRHIKYCIISQHAVILCHVICMIFACEITFFDRRNAAQYIRDVGAKFELDFCELFVCLFLWCGRWWYSQTDRLTDELTAMPMQPLWRGLPPKCLGRPLLSDICR